MRALLALAGLVLTAVLVVSPSAQAGEADPLGVLGLRLPEALALVDDRVEIVLLPAERPEGAEAGRMVVVEQIFDDPVLVLTVEGEVPGLVGSTVTEAAEELALSGLEIELVTADAADTDVVREQEPERGSTLPLGSAVAIATRVAAGSASEDATAATEVTEESTGRATVEQPEVPDDDGVVEEETTPPRAAVGLPLVALLALVGAAVGVALWLGRSHRAPRSAEPPRLRSRADHLGQVSVDVPPGRPGIAVRLEPRGDHGRQTLEEAVHG